jgi:hypothetical protein
MASAGTFPEFRLTEEIRKLAVNWLPVRQPLPVDKQQAEIVEAAV